MKRIEGLVAAPVTPMQADGSIAPEVIPAYAAFLVRNGVSGVFVNGTTGESLSLTRPEREAMAEAWVAAAKGTSLRVIIHVGCDCLADARALAAHAQRVGADAVGAMPPVFFKAAGLPTLASLSAEIARACPELPFYYYHIPSMTGQDVPIRKLLPMIRALAPNVAGAKYTFENIMDYTLCLEAGFDVLFGRDEILLPALAMGARGAVGSTYNMMGPLYCQIIRAFDAGEMAQARTLQLEGMRIIEAMIDGSLGAPFFVTLKTMLTMLGVPCGPVRLPLAQPDAAAVATLQARITAAVLLRHAAH